MTLPDIFQPFEKLITIDVMGEKRMVPENNSLLRCFQFLAMESISYGDFCWNGECLNCQVSIESGEKEKSIIACRVNATEGMKVIRLSEDIDLTPDE